MTIRTKADQNKIAIRLNLVSYLAPNRREDQRKVTIITKSDEIKIAIRLKLVQSLSIFRRV